MFPLERMRRWQMARPPDLENDKEPQVRSAVLGALEQLALQKSSVGGLEAKRSHLHAGPQAPGLQKLLEEKLPISARALYRFPGPGRAICHRRIPFQRKHCRA